MKGVFEFSMNFVLEFSMNLFLHLVSLCVVLEKKISLVGNISFLVFFSFTLGLINRRNIEKKNCIVTKLFGAFLFCDLLMGNEK
jgi:intracellular septation protein A